MKNIDIVSFQAPTKICHHVFIPMSLVTFLHGFGVLMKSFPLFITYTTPVFRGTPQMDEQKMYFSIYITTKVMKTSNQILNYFNVISMFNISKRFSNNFYKRIPGCCFDCIHTRYKI